jgi:hypothetical protein
MKVRDVGAANVPHPEKSVSCRIVRIVLAAICIAGAGEFMARHLQQA